MVKLFTFYFDSEGIKRIDASRTMRKYKEAYVEASLKLKNLEYFSKLTSTELPTVSNT